MKRSTSTKKPRGTAFDDMRERARRATEDDRGLCLEVEQDEFDNPLSIRFAVIGVSGEISAIAADSLADVIEQRLMELVADVRRAFGRPQRQKLRVVGKKASVA